MKLIKVTGDNLLNKVKLKEVVSTKATTPSSKEAVESIISWCGGTIPIPIVVNQTTGNIIFGQELFRAIQRMNSQQLKMIKEIPLIFIEQPDSQVEKNLLTTLPDTAPHWTANDLVRFYSDNGFGDYTKILNLCTSKPSVLNNYLGQPRCMAAAIALCPGESAQVIQKRIKYGAFKVKPIQVKNAKRYADETFKVADALQLQADGQYTLDNIVSIMKELQRYDGTNGHSNTDRIAEFQASAANIKATCRKAWNRSCWHSAFSLVENSLP